MGVGLEARHHAPPHATARMRAAHGANATQPQQAERQDRTRQRQNDSHVPVASWPLVLVMAACEIAWLLLLAFAAHRLLLQPILEY